MKQLVSLLVLLGLYTFSYAQPGKDQVEKAMQEQFGKEGMQKLENFLNNISDAKLESSYSFPMSFNIKVSDYYNGKESRVSTVKYYVNEKDNVFAFRGKDFSKGKKALLIFDSKNGSVAVIDESKKEVMPVNIGAVGGMGMMQKAVDSVMNENKINCSKTGNSKKIAGYNCEEHVCVSEDKTSKGEVWVTNEVKINIANDGNKGPWSLYAEHISGMSGMLMEGTFYENDKVESKMQVTDVNKKANYTVNMSRYKKTSIFQR